MCHTVCALLLFTEMCKPTIYTGHTSGSIILSLIHHRDGWGCQLLTPHLTQGVSPGLPMNIIHGSFTPPKEDEDLVTDTATTMLWKLFMGIKSMRPLRGWARTAGPTTMTRNIGPVLRCSEFSSDVISFCVAKGGKLVVDDHIVPLPDHSPTQVDLDAAIVDHATEDVHVQTSRLGATAWTVWTTAVSWPGRKATSSNGIRKW